MAPTHDLAETVRRGQAGDADAFAVLVRRFQDMAVAYGYSVLRDLQSAEDASQEAFLEAFRDLPTLREPAAFPGWLRRIVFKQCDRIRRRRTVATVPLEQVAEPSALLVNQADELEQREVKDQILEAMDLLPEHERLTAMLFYMSGYSHREVATFLGVTVPAVKKRLHSARNRLREHLLLALENTLRESRPSQDERFATRVMDILKAARAGDLGKVKELLEQDPRLLRARDPMGNTALILAVNSGHHELAELLLASGVQLDIHEASAIGKTERVTQLLRADPTRLDSFSAEGFTPLSLAAHFGHAETVAALVKQGADLDKISLHPIEVTPLHAALFGRKPEVAKLLIEAGADVRVARGGKELPREGWTPLHYAAGFGFAELVKPLIDRGARTDVRDIEGNTPLDVAEKAGHLLIVDLLRCCAAGT
jgi:RNA polymerase sigma factor (sigma-70 family)